MKNLVSLFAVLFLFSLTSCSDVNDNSFLTSPIMEKSNQSIPEIDPSTTYPYTYLFNFNEVKELKYTTLEGENSIEFYLSEASSQYKHLYVIVNYIQDRGPKMFFIDKFSDYSFKVQGVEMNEVGKISVYGIEAGSAEENITYPFRNNSVMDQLHINAWKSDNKEVVIDCGGIWPSSLKYVFAELDTKHGSFLIFLQRPYVSNFIIPEYGKYGVEAVKLFGYQTIMEGSLARN